MRRRRGSIGDLGSFPVKLLRRRSWRTRQDPFAKIWAEVHGQLQEAPGLEAKTLFAWLQSKYPGKFGNSQLRSFQRGVKRWRATAGPAKEVFFSQVHHPARLCASDFTHMKSLAVTIGGQSFDHLVYHWVLTYSNWESITICFSESFESLSEGLQNAVWELGGVPQRHRTDRMSLAVNNASNEKEFTQRYRALLDYYGLEMEKIQAQEPNENGDAEQSHRRFKEAVEQSLLLRGHRDFENRETYERFLKELVAGRNSGRRKRLDEELPRLRRLPPRRRESYKRLSSRVYRGSLIHADHNTYSVPSRLMGEKVEVRLYVEHVEVWYAQQETSVFRACGDGRGTPSITGTLSTGWCGNQGLLRTMCTAKNCFPRAAFAWLMMPCGKHSRRERTRSTWGFSTWRHARARRRWTRRCERFWPATDP